MSQRHRERSPGRREDAIDWKVKEGRFHLQQLLDRATLRLKEGRGTSFDILFLNTITCGIISDRNPVELVKLEQQSWLNQIEEVLEYETNPLACEYWKAVRAVLEFTKKHHTRTNAEVCEEIRKMLGGKNYEELCRLKVQVKEKLKDPDADPDYWQGILVELEEFKVIEWLVECNKKLLVKRKAEVSNENDLILLKDFIKSATSDSVTVKRDAGLEDTPEINWDNSKEALRLYEAFMAKSRGSNEFLFEDEGMKKGSLTVRSVKPRYVSLVTMKVEWTKYNLAHFSADTPPPPTPQGYSFTIFYPRRSDPTLTPTYSTEPEPTDPENFLLLRFVGGAPYEDLVFKIGAHRWELGHRQGFTCTFENDVLTLEFQFKKHFYK